MAKEDVVRGSRRGTSRKYDTLAASSWSKWPHNYGIDWTAFATLSMHADNNNG